MREHDVLDGAFAMPRTSPSCPMGPYRYIDREYLTIAYRTDPDALRRVVPAPLQSDASLVNYEFIRRPDSTGFGECTESGQVIPVRLGAQLGGHVQAMFPDDDPPIAGGRELWGLPKKLAQPSLRVARCRAAGGAGGARLPAEGHPACRWPGADLRAGAGGRVGHAYPHRPRPRPRRGGA